MLGTFPVHSPGNLVSDGANIWVANYDSDSVLKLRASDGARRQEVVVGDGPVGIAFDGTYIWVANNNDNTVTKLRASDGAPRGTFNVGDGPGEIFFDGSKIWVANHYGGENTVGILRAADGSLLTKLTHTRVDGFASDGTQMWFTNGEPNTENVSIRRHSDGALLQTLSVDPGARGILFDGTSIWVAAFHGDSVSKVTHTYP